MTATKKLKASDRQAILRKVATLLKKKYGGGVPRTSRNVLETMLFACCLENATQAEAEAAYRRLHEAFYDLNEIRVSSVSEIEVAISGLDDAAWKALRIRDILQFVFEKYYEFDFEPLRRTTQEAALKQLERIKSLSPFVRLHTLQSSLGSHVIPLDESLCRVVAWMGMIPAEMPPGEAAEEMKSSVRKSDVPLLCHLLRSVANDPVYRSSFKLTKSQRADGAIDPNDAPERLNLLLTSVRRRKTAKKVTRKKPAPTKRRTKSSGRGKPVTKRVSRPKRSAKKTTKPKTARRKK